MYQQKIFFSIASFCTLTLTSLTSLPLLFYAPYLAYVLMKHPLKKALWHSILCGVIMDSMQSTIPFGYTSLGYSLVTLLLYRQKWLFFNDKFFSLSFFSAFFSFIFSFFQFGVLYFVQKPLNLSWISLCSDFIFMPTCDGLYAFILFTAPYLIYHQIKKHGFCFLFIRKVT